MGVGSLHHVASTEPRSFERGNERRHRLAGNQRAASTEPRSFERGNKYRTARRKAGQALQRSRVLSNAETGHKNTMKVTVTKLQRSRVLSNAETDQRRRLSPAGPRASTEPRSFERGNMVCGRTLRCRGQGFNGAAFFRTRKLVGSIFRASAAPGFNGAAFFRTRKLAGKNTLIGVYGAASTEPRSFERGNHLRRRLAARSKLLQRSRVLSNAETRLTKPSSREANRLQRSRVLSNAETFFFPR